jgi:predicted metal-dependent peptidase
MYYRKEDKQLSSVYSRLIFEARLPQSRLLTEVNENPNPRKPGEPYKMSDKQRKELKKQGMSDEQIDEIERQLDVALNSQENQYQELSTDELTRLDNLLTRARYELYKRAPYYGILLQNLKTVVTYDVPTMGVDDYGNIYINPNFALKQLSYEEVIGVLLHETLHIANNTFFRKGRKDHTLWNVATDFVMNRDILESGYKLPSIGCLPLQEGGRWVLPPMEHAMEVAGTDITDMTAEELYKVFEKLDNEQEKKKGNQNQNQQGNSQQGQGQSGQPQPGQGQSGQPQPGQGDQQAQGQQGNEQEGQGQGQDDQQQQQGKGQGQGGQQKEDQGLKDDTTFKESLAGKQEQLDKHITAGKGSPGQVNMPSDNPIYNKNQPAPGTTEAQKKADMRNKVDRAKQQASNRGNAEGGFRNKFGEEKVKVDWRQILKDVIKPSNQLRSDMSKPNIRMAAATGSRGASNLVYQGRTIKEQEKVKTIIAIDTSGSINDEVLSIYIGYIFQLLKQFKEVELMLILWNVNAYYHEIVNSKKSSVPAIMAKVKQLPVKEGGTLMSSVKKLLDHLKITKVDNIIYFTDGYVEDNPQLPEVKNPQKNLIFMVNGDGRYDILEKKGKVFPVDV